MSDLSYTIEVKGVQDLDKLGNVIEKLTGTLNAGAGAGKSLEELRKILVGIKGKGSALEELATAAKGFTDATAEMRRGVGDNFKSLERLLKSEFKQLTTVMQQGGAAGGKAFTDGVADSVTKGTSDATAAIARSGKTLAAKARAEATKAYEAMVGGDANAKIKPAGMSALFQMREAGAQISAYHKNLLDAWVQSSNQTYAAIKAATAAEQKNLLKAERDEQARYLITLRRMAREQTKERDAIDKLVADSFRKGKTLIVKAAKDELKAQTDQLIAVKKAEDARLKTFYASAASQVAAATNRSTLPYTSYNANTQRRGLLQNFDEPENEKQLGFFQRYQKAMKDLSGSGGGIRRLGDDMGYLHSASRGVASGFNLMWLTWGQLAPLFVGAGLSNAFVQTAKTGMEVAHSFAIIQNVGGATAQEVAALKVNLDELARNGHVGPEQIAEAMKTLSLAGLDANKILAVTGDVMNFSVAGTTSLQTAASTLMSVSTAFNMGAEGFARVGDVISKAAAESMTSVESFSEAMKTASVINAQYGVSLEDTATGIALLSQLGIQGSAAGTALRNMYADLSGRSIQVSKLLKAQGIEMRTATGAFRPMIEVVAELDKKLGDLSGIGQKNLLQGLLSERGAKPIIEALRLIRSNVDTTGTVFSNKLEEMRAKIEDSAGFMAVAAAKMSLSSKNQFESLGATMKNSLNNAFKEMEPALLLIFERMKQAFSSPEFQSGLLFLTNAVANFTLILAENAKTVTYLVGAYVALKTAQFVLGATGSALVSLTALLTAAKAKETVAVAANTVALTANAAAGTAAAKASGAAGVGGALLGLGRIIPGINIAVGLGTAAWMAYELWSSRSKDAASDAAELYDNKISSRLKDEADKLERVNNLLAQGLSLREATARAESTTGLGDSTASIDATKAAYLQNLQAINNYRAALKSVQGTENQHYVPSFLKELRQLEDNSPRLSKALRDALARGQQIDTDMERVNKESKRKADFLAKELEARQKQLENFGSKSFELGAPGSDRESLKAVSAVKQNLMKETEEANRNELAAIKAHQDSKQRLLKSQADNQLITQGEFMMREIALTEEGEAKQLQALLEGKEKYAAAYQEQANALAASYAEWTEKNPQATAEQFEKQAQDTAAQLQNLARDYGTTIAKMDQDGKAIKDNAFERLTLSANKAKGELIALGKQFEDFWKKEDARAKQQERNTALEDQLRYASPEQAAYIQAVATEFERLQPEIEKTERELELLNKSWEFFIELEAASGALSAAQQVQFDALREKIRLYREELEKLREAQGTGSGKAGNDALTKYAKEESKRLQDGLSDSIMTALFEGGKAGSKKLRDLVVNELKKPIKLVVDVVANMIMSSLGLGAAGSAAAGGAAGSAGSSMLGSFASGLSGNLLTGGVGASGMAGFTSGLSAWGAGGSVAGVLSNPGLYSLAEIAGALGPIALGVGAILLLAKKGKTPGEQHTGGFYSSTGATGMDAALGITDGTESWARDLIKRANPEMEKLAKTAVEGVIKASTAQAKLLGMDIAVGIDAGFAANTNGKAKNKNAFGYFDVKINGETVAEYVNRELGTDLTQAVATWTSDMQDAVSEWVLGGEDAAKALAKDGETATQTVTRLSTSLVLVNDALNIMNKTLLAASVASGDFASDIVDAFGGQETFTSAHQAYFAAFYTESERAAATTRNLGIQFANMNLTLPKTNEEYRKLVEAQDLTTEAGRQTYASLIQLAPAFNETTLAAENLKTEIENLLSSVGITTSELADTIRDGLLGRISGAEAGGKVADIITNGIYNALAQGAAQQITNILTQGIITPVVQAAVAGQSITGLVSSAAIDAVITQARAAMTAISQVLNDPAIQAMLADIGTSVAGLFSGFKAPTLPSYVPTVFEDTTDAADAAKDAAQEAFEMLQKAVNAQRELAQEQLDALIKVRDIARAASNDLFGFKGNAGMGLAQAQAFISNAAQNAQATGYMPDADMLEEAVAVLKDQLTANKFKTLQEFTLAKSLAAADLDAIADAADPQITALEAQLESLNAILETAQAQLDALNGVNTSVLSVAEALANFQAALSAAGGGTSAGGGGFGGVQTSTQMFKNMTTKDMFGGVHAATVSGSGSAWNYRSQSGSDVSTLSGGVWTPQGYASKNPDIRAYFDANQDAIKQYNQPTNFNDYLAWHFATYGISEGRKFATGGVHSGGWAMVGEQGPELLQMPAGRVYNNGQTQDILAGDSLAAAEVAALRQEIEEMRAEVRATAVNTGKTQRLLDRITRNGESMQVTVVT